MGHYSQIPFSEPTWGCFCHQKNKRQNSKIYQNFSFCQFTQTCFSDCQIFCQTYPGFQHNFWQALWTCVHPSNFLPDLLRFPEMSLHHSIVSAGSLREHASILRSFTTALLRLVSVRLHSRFPQHLVLFCAHAKAWGFAAEVCIRHEGTQESFRHSLQIPAVDRSASNDLMAWRKGCGGMIV